MPRTTSTARDGSSGSPQTRSVATRGTISERSTLTSLRTPGSTGVVRGDASSPHSSLPKSTHNHGHSSYYGTYGYSGHSYPWYYGGYSGGYWGGHYGSWGIGWSWGWGSFSIGWGYRPWHIGHWWRPFVYFGAHSIAILGNGAWYIQPYHHGWWGYNYGAHSYFHSHSWRSHHWFHYHGSYCRVTRPYWYGYTRWWDWRPYSYGYTALSYDSLYDDGYDDGYNRGYEDGAEDVSNYRDNRRRDSIGSSGKRPQPEKDRARGDAADEYRHEMNRGSDAFAKGDYGTATKAFKEAVILDPGSADARYSLAVSAFAQGKYAFSAFALRRAIVLDAERSNIDMAKAFGGPDVLKGYVDHLDGELKDLPEDPDLLLLRGFTALRTGDARTAAAMLDRALAQLPQDVATKTLHQEAMEALEGE